MTSNLTTTTILLVLAVLLLWMAITDKLSRLIDAWNVALGKSTATQTASNTSGTPVTPTNAAAMSTTFSIPALPSFSTLSNPQVPHTYYNPSQTPIIYS